MPPMYVPIPIFINGGGGGGELSGAGAIVIWACIIVLFILIGIMTYSLCRDIWDEYKQDRKMKKRDRK